MNESRHNTHLIVTVLSAWVALMCGVPAAQGAQAQRDLTQIAVHYTVKSGAELQSPVLPTVGEDRFLRRSVKLIRLSNFKPGSFLQLLDLAAMLPRIDSFAEPATFSRELLPIRENTHSLSQPINFKVITRLPRAGLI
jgi:hypothetical protein